MAGTVTVEGTATPPEPLQVAACDIGTSGPDGERYEGMLVQVHDVTVTDENPNAVDGNDYGAMEVDSCLWLDDSLYDYEADNPEARALGTVYSEVTGPLYWTYDERRVLPRGPEDLVAAP